MAKSKPTASQLGAAMKSMGINSAGRKTSASGRPGPTAASLKSAMDSMGVKNRSKKK